MIKCLWSFDMLHYEKHLKCLYYQHFNYLSFELKNDCKDVKFRSMFIPTCFKRHQCISVQLKFLFILVKYLQNFSILNGCLKLLH